ncbi:MAG: aminopeptidase [Chloroflexota bacterium]
MTDPRIVNLARLLVRYSTEVRPGDKVCIRGTPLEPQATPLVREIYREVLRAGGHPYVYLNAEGLRRVFLEEANDKQLRTVDPINQLFFETFDVEFRIRCEANTKDLTGADPEKMKAWQQAYADLNRTFARRFASGEYRWVFCLFPTHGAAQDAEMSLAEFEDFVYASTFADVDDPIAAWTEYQVRQARWVEWLSGKKQVQLKGPHIDLSLSIEGRSFISCHGKVNMPDGEIFTSPVEESVDGWVRFTFPAIYLQREVQDVELSFEQGRVVKANASKGLDYLEKMLETDAGARYLGELGIGTNHRLTRFTRNMLFDEKMTGTIHLALGLGFPAAGGKNQSSVHWDMLCDMHQGEILVDDEVFYQGGQIKV